jgi:hypothetical protein
MITESPLGLPFGTAAMTRYLSSCANGMSRLGDALYDMPKGYDMGDLSSAAGRKAESPAISSRLSILIGLKRFFPSSDQSLFFHVD